MDPVWTIHRHILAKEREHPDASGLFTTLLYQIALSAKIINRHTSKAGLLDVLGRAGQTNVQGENVMKLDVFANAALKEILLRSGTVCAVVSEEEERTVTVPEGPLRGPYVVHFDPLDGSSNIDANVSVGTIFSIHRRRSKGPDITDEDILQPGRSLIASGYVVYGSSTMLVYTAGAGVHGFTYDPEYGEFMLSHPDITSPDICKVYSANEANAFDWRSGTRRFLEHIKGRNEPRYEKTTARYIGSLVADFHRNLLYGGVFLYPESRKAPTGKLRLLYEAAPLAFIAEQAGGAASTGTERILDMVPESLHQRVPLIIGNREEVHRYEAFLAAG